MASGAQIGALNVKLGIDSAEFSAGLQNAQTKLAGFAKAAGVGLTALAAASVAAGTALGFAVKGAIDAADELSKASQKVGVTTEALSRLKYAADFSDVAFETLTGSLAKLSKNMGDIASGKGGTAQSAFMALGISVKDATGNLRSADAVMTDVAEKFSRMEDGATKTALAQQLFGKSGAELIPLLNGGRDGLKAMADESDRLGLTISTKTGRAAELFNDTLTKVGKILQGVTNKVMEAALPSLQSLADLLASPEFASAAQTFGTTLISVFTAVAQAVVGITNAARDAFEFMKRGSSAVGMTAEQISAEIKVTESLLANPNINEVAKERSAAYLAELKKQLASLDFMDPVGSGAAFGDVGGFGFGTAAKALSVDMDAFATSTKAATEAKKALDQVMAEGLQVWEATRDPLETLQQQLDKLGNLLNKGAIDWDTYGRAVNSATMNASATTLGALGEISGALAGAFKDNKAFAVANAVINTAEGITKALAQGGIFGFASAAAIGISGAAQVATILSAQPGSAASAPSVAAPPPTSEQPGQSMSLTVRAEGRGASMINEFWTGLQEQLADQGKQIVVVPT